MATTKNLNARLTLKYDSYVNWTTNNPILLAGEVAIATIPNPDTANGVKQAPSVLMKVGDGSTRYNSLQFVSGLAANVSAWALADNKPVYTANEIEGLADFIGNEDTNTVYQLVAVEGNANSFKLQSKDGTDPESVWADVSTITIPAYNDTEVRGLISDNAGEIAAIKGDYLKAADKTELEGKITAAQSAAEKHADDAVAALAGTHSADKTELEGKITAAQTAATTAANSYTDEKVGALTTTHNNDKAELEGKITAAQTAATTAANSYTDGKVAELAGTHATDKAALEATIAANATTASEQAAAALTNAKGYTDEKVAELAGDLEDAIAGVHTHSNLEVLEGITAEKVAAWDAAEGNAKSYTDTAIETLTNGAVKDAADAAAAAQAEVDALEGVHATDKAELEGKITDAQEAADAAQEAADAAQADVDALAQTHATDKAALEASIAEVSGAVTTLSGTHATDKAALEASIAEVSGAVATEKARAEGVEADFEDRIKTMENFFDGANFDEEGKNVLDTLVEIQSTIANDQTGAAAMLEAINKNKDDIAALSGTHATDKAELEGKITAAQEAATTAANSYTDGKVAELAGTHATDKAALEKAITDGDAATLESAKGYTDEKVGALTETHNADKEALTAAIATAQEAATTAANTYADGIVKQLAEGAVATNAANIKAIADDYLTSADKTELEGKITAAQSAAEATAKGYADAVEAKAVLDGDTVIINCGTSANIPDPTPAA